MAGKLLITFFDENEDDSSRTFALVPMAQWKEHIKRIETRIETDGEIVAQSDSGNECYYSSIDDFTDCLKVKPLSTMEEKTLLNLMDFKAVSPRSEIKTLGTYRDIFTPSFVEGY
jgi:hypothetical protein